MAIDPMLYEKVSGRKGDPYSRLGEALAQNDAAKARRTAQKDVPGGTRMWLSYYKYKFIAGAVVGVIFLIGLLIAKLFR